MPNLDGRKTSYLLQQNPDTQTIPIIILTASSDVRERKELESIVHAILQKPLHRSQLVLTLKSSLKPKIEQKPQLIEPDLNLLKTSEKSSPVSPKSPELIRHIQQEIERTFPLLQQKMTISDLAQFVKRLRNLGTDYQYNILLNYVNTLQEQLDNFDWNSIPKTVEHFPQICQNSKKDKC